MRKAVRAASVRGAEVLLFGGKWNVPDFSCGR